MSEPNKRYFVTGMGRNFYNCTLGVIAKQMEPFVIDQNEGFEIRMLKVVGEVLNINFNITISQNLSYIWGSKTENGTWTGELKDVFENLYFGVGNIDMGMDYATDFAFSHFYHIEPTVFVVPKAHLVPKWRILFAIFSLQMWGISIGVFVIGAVCMYLASKIRETVVGYKTLGNSFLSSIQLFIGHATPDQPTSDFTRVFFAALSVFSIIIASIYTSSLIYYIKNPISEFQPKKNIDILDQFGNFRYRVGGTLRYKNLFNVSKPAAKKVYDIFETADGKNDTINYWLEKVGNDRNIWTISSEFYVKYLVATDNKIVTDENFLPKVYVFNKDNRLMSYPVSLIARKGHPILRKVDDVIKKLLHGGFIIHYCNRYLGDIGMGYGQDYRGDDNPFEALSVHHLQGAFALLVLGYVLGLVAMLFELGISEMEFSIRKRKFGYIP